MTIFEELFGTRPQVESVAHGRINLIGEHTDFNSGRALPTCAPQTVRVQLSPRGDDRIQIASLNMQGSKRRFEYLLREETRKSSWADPIQGLTAALLREGMTLTGFDCLVESDIPMGSGLASGAAMEVAVLKGLSELFELGLEKIRIADLARRAENDFLGVRFGIMNPMAVALGRLDEALYIDTLDRSYRRLPLPVERMELIVMNSGLNHSHWEPGHRERRAECEKICAMLDIRDLRQLETSDLAHLHQDLPDKLMRRARHVITENERVLEAAEALESGDVRRLGEILNVSHLSLQQDYRVSLPQIDLLVKLAQAHSEVFGARLMGSGFGGSIVMLAQPGVAMRITEHIQDEYSKRTGLHASVLVPPAPVGSQPHAQPSAMAASPQQWLI